MSTESFDYFDANASQDAKCYRRMPVLKPRKTNIAPAQSPEAQGHPGEHEKIGNLADIDVVSPICKVNAREDRKFQAGKDGALPATLSPAIRVIHICPR